MTNFTDQFKEGDYITFFTKYTQSDFEKFANISGDLNKLHHDMEYASASKYKEPILPLHLSAAPLSRIAGMYMPGLPSLYLGHQINALKPIFYNKKINYHAKIISINENFKILTIRVLIVQDSNICIVAKMRVQARYSSWPDQKIDIDFKNSKDRSYALITGATGEIGKAISRRLAACNFNLCLHARDQNKLDLLINELSKYKCNIKFVISDLKEEEGREKLKRIIKELDTDLSSVIHCASSPAKSSLKELLNTNYLCLKDIVNSSLRGFLKRQNGRIIFLSTIYLAKPIIDFEDYISIKSMSTAYLSSLNNFYSNYDISYKSILPSVVDSPFSKDAGDIDKLLPEEVAEQIENMIIDSNNECLLQELNGIKKGLYGFIENKKNFLSTESESNIKSFSDQNSKLTKLLKNNQDKYLKLKNILKSSLLLPDDADVENLAYGYTPSWDSLAQLQIIAEFESVFNTHLNSKQLETINSYSAFAKLIEDLDHK